MSSTSFACWLAPVMGSLNLLLYDKIFLVRILFLALQLIIMANMSCYYEV
ncbi:hypothetical protein DSUL_80021 [Desulfovibrionales bacterium]